MLFVQEIFIDPSHWIRICAPNLTIAKGIIGNPPNPKINQDTVAKIELALLLTSEDPH